MPSKSKAILFEYDGALFFRILGNGSWSQIQTKALCRSCGEHVKDGETFLAQLGEGHHFIEHAVCPPQPLVQPGDRVKRGQKIA